MRRSSNLSEQRAFRLALGGLLLAYLAPVLLTEVLPMQDLPIHMAVVRTLTDEGQPGWSARFASRLEFEPYAGYYAICLGLAKIVGAGAANRLILASYIFALPLSFLYLLGAIDYSRRWACLATLPLVYSDCYLVGFVNYLLALPLALLGLGMILRIVKADRSPGACIGLCAISIGIYLSHPFLLAVLLLLALVVGACCARRPGRAMAGPLSMSPALLLSLRWGLFHSHLPTNPGWLPTFFKVKYLALTPALALTSDAPFFVGTMLLASGPVVLLLAARAQRPQWTEMKAGLVFSLRQRFYPVILTLVIVYFAAPFVVGSTVWFDLRLAVLVWLVVLTSIPARLFAPRLAKACAVGACLVFLAGMLKLHGDFAVESRPLMSMAQAMPPGQAVLPILFDRRSEAYTPFYTGRIPFFSLFAHFESYYHLARGGVGPFLTFHPSLEWIPLQLQDPFLQREFNISDPFFPKRLLRRLPALAPHFDVVLVRGGSQEQLAEVGRIGELRAQVGEYRAFAVNVPRVRMRDALERR
jgi:hypothetical protein